MQKDIFKLGLVLLVGIGVTIGLFAVLAVRVTYQSTEVQRTQPAPSGSTVDFVPAAATVAMSPAPPVEPTHHYDFRDGHEYGYTAAISLNDRDAGRVAGQILMFSYAGYRKGVYQVQGRKGAVITAAECSRPCEVIKLLTTMDTDGMREVVNVERIRNVPGMLVGMVLEDAMQGRLEQHVVLESTGTRYGRWVTEDKGLVRTRIVSERPLGVATRVPAKP